MDRLTLSHIDEELGLSEVAELCFLCLDVVNRKRLEGVSTTYLVSTPCLRKKVTLRSYISFCWVTLQIFNIITIIKIILFYGKNDFPPLYNQDKLKNKLKQGDIIKR